MNTAEDKSGVRIFPPLIYLAAIGLGLLIQMVMPVRLGPQWHGTRLALGSVLVAIPIAIVVWAVTLFRSAGTTPNPAQPTTALVFSGPYRFTRNPMYVAWVFLCVGVALLANNVWVAVMALPAALVTQKVVIEKEEAYLTRKFGDDYRAYLGRVRRWL